MPVTPPVVYPPLPPSIPSGVYQRRFSFVSDPPVKGLQSSEKSLRYAAKQDAEEKLKIFKAQVAALAVPSPPVVAAQGPHVSVIRYDWHVVSGGSAAAISVSVGYVCHVWSEYP